MSKKIELYMITDINIHPFEDKNLYSFFTKHNLSLSRKI